MDELPNQATTSDVARDIEADDDLSGRTVGEFRLLRSLGRGGMGQVYLAEQTSLKRQVAVKMLRPELAANRTALQRFRAEAEAVARLNHANIVQIYFVGEQDGVHYMALEYVQGRNLRDYLARKGPPELPACLSIMRQVAAALQRAHDAGFVHRDVKPENILLTRKGEAKVTDFGLSRCFTDNGQQLNLTQSGVSMGTPLYMSPEQVQGKPVDQRTDIYSYGVTCFTLLTGSTPFRGANAFEVAVQHVQVEPPALASLRPDLPPEWCAMVHKMMAKDPAQRHQSFKEVLRDLSRLKESLAGAATAAAPLVLSVDALPAPSDFSSAPTEPLSTKRDRWFRRAVLAAALLGLFAGGVTARLVRQRLVAKEAAAPNEPVAEKPLVSDEESFLLTAAKRAANPDTTSFNKVKEGLGAQIELAAYYFKARRLDDAANFFRELQERKYHPMPVKGQEHPYRAFARLGQALIMAFRDDPRALEELEKLVRPNKPNTPPGPFNLNIAGVPAQVYLDSDLRPIIVEALDRIAVNLKKGRLDNELLEALRRPPLRPGARPKPPGVPL